MITTYYILVISLVLDWIMLQNAVEKYEKQFLKSLGRVVTEDGMTNTGLDRPLPKYWCYLVLIT